MHKDAKHWAAKDSITGKGGYFTCRSREQPVMYLAVYDDGYFKGHEAPAVGGGPKPVSWAGDVDGLGYFLRTDESKWQIYTDPSGSAVALSQLEEIQRLHGIPNMDFDARLRFILYGQSARIYVLTDCFHTEFRDDVYTEDHPLYKASSESRLGVLPSLRSPCAFSGSIRAYGFRMDDRRKLVTQPIQPQPLSAQVQARRCHRPGPRVSDTNPHACHHLHCFATNAGNVADGGRT